MATRDELYPSRWLKAPDVETPTVATIAECRLETVGQGSKAERKPILSFHDDALKPLILNATNFDAVAAISGRDDSDEWGGVTIELFAVDVQGPQGMTRGVRIRPPRRRPVTKAKPKPTTATRKPATDDLEDAMPTLDEEAEVF